MDLKLKMVLFETFLCFMILGYIIILLYLDKHTMYIYQKWSNTFLYINNVCAEYSKLRALCKQTFTSCSLHISVFYCCSCCFYTLQTLIHCLIFFLLVYWKQFNKFISLKLIWAIVHLLHPWYESLYIFSPLPCL